MLKRLLALSLTVILLLSLCFVALTSVSAVENGLYIHSGDKTYFAQVGDVVSYKIDLQAEKKFVDIQVTVNYDTQKLRPLSYAYYDNSVMPWQDEWNEYAPEKYTPNLTNTVMNLKDCVKFNDYRLSGYDFTTEKNLFSVEFMVLNPGYSEISADFEEMTILGGEESYFQTIPDRPTVTEGITIKEYLEGTPLDNPPLKSQIDNENIILKREYVTVYFYAPEEFVNTVSAYSFDYDTGEEYLGVFRNRGTKARNEGNGYYSIQVPVGTDYVVFCDKMRYPDYSNLTSDIIPVGEKDVVAVPSGVVTKDTGMLVYGVTLSDVSQMPENPTYVPQETTEINTNTVPTESTAYVTYPEYEDTGETHYVSLNNGERFAYKVGDTFTYTVNLKAEELFEDFQAYLTYDPDMLSLNRVSEDYIVEGMTYAPNLGDNLVLNARNSGRVGYNSIKLNGFNFRNGNVLLTLSFTVVDAGESLIWHQIQEMNLRNGFGAYFNNSNPVIDEGISLDYTVSGGTQVNPTEPTTAAPESTYTYPTVPDDYYTDPVYGNTAPEYTYPELTDAPESVVRPESTVPGSPEEWTQPCTTVPMDYVPTHPMVWAPESTYPPSIDSGKPSDEPAISQKTEAAVTTQAISTTQADVTSATDTEKKPLDAPNTGAVSYTALCLFTIAVISAVVVVFRRKTER